MKKLIRETAEEILQEYTSCYSEADEDCLVKMLEKLDSNMAMEIFEEIEGKIAENDDMFERCASRLVSSDYANGRSEVVGEILHFLAELRKKYESEGADDGRI